MESTIQTTLENQRSFFNTGSTKDISIRLEHLHTLKQVIASNSDAICNALWKDLHKPAYESYMTEIGIVLGEIDKHIHNLKKWAKPRKVASPLFLFPSKSRIVYEPLGLVLIIAPWNYPFQLLLNPLVGAISAGNTVALKPSYDAPETSIIIGKIISEVFDTRYVSIFGGEHGVTNELLAYRFDHIFFTGSTSFGKVVMEAAAKHLTPVTLELGGKSPCMVDKDADINLAAKRIAFGKLINAGQTCVAPDYLFIHRSVKKQMIEKMIEHIKAFYGEDASLSPDYVRMVNDRAFDRVSELIHSGEVIYGGQSDKKDLYIAPTLLDNVSADSPIMQQEIFGPVLPILAYDDIAEPIAFINRHDKPLALYFFGSKQTARQVISETSSGGTCINDTILHLSNNNLPFGGVGASGMGRYHGRFSFETFSNQRAVLYASRLIDIPMKYAPYKSSALLKRFM